MRFFLTPPFIFLCISYFSFFNSLIQAQQASALSEAVETLPEVTVMASPEQPPSSSLPKASTTTSVYGPDLSLIDIPRDVLVVSKEQLKTVMLQSVNDLIAFSPSVNPTQATGNVVSEPVVRGLPATVFRNGMLVGFSSGGNWGPLLNVNADDSLDLVTGPVSLVYGPQEFAGGYLNELTKQPFFDRLHADAYYTMGMYGSNFWNLDVGGPIKKDKLAYRLDYFGQEGYGPFNYYNGSYLNRQCGYLALSWKPMEAVRIDWNGEIDWNSFLPYAGINRPTQSLIDSGLYQSGSWIGYYTPPVSPSAPFGQFHPGRGTPPPGFGYAIDWGPLVPISSRTNLFDTPLDFTKQLYAVSQAITTVQLTEDLSLVNNSLFEFYQANSAQPVPDPTWVVMPYGYNVEDRLELLFTEEQSGKACWQNVDVGLAFRFLTDLEYSGSWHPTSNQANLIQPLTQAQASAIVPYALAISPAYNNPFLTDLPIPGYPQEFFNVDNFASTQCNFYEISPFLQDILHVGEKFNLFLGGRLDAYFVNAQPPSGTPAELLYPFTAYEATSMSALLPQLTISPTYRPFPWMNCYATYYFGQTTAQSIFGSFAPEFTSTYYHQTQSLYEVGTKFNLLNDTFFLGLSAYAQTGFIPAFVLPGGTTPTVSATVEGIQLQGNYQPTRRFWASFGFNYMQGYENWTNTNGVGPTTFTPYSATVAAIYGLPVSTIVSLAPGIYPFIGFPKEYGNLMVSYKFDWGLGISLWAIAQGGQFLSYDYSVRAPAWYTLNASIFYTFSNWELRIWFYNFTDNHYWIAGAPGFTPARTANLEYAAFQMPFWVQAMIRYSF